MTDFTHDDMLRAQAGDPIAQRKIAKSFGMPPSMQTWAVPDSPQRKPGDPTAGLLFFATIVAAIELIRYVVNSL